jgi:hypothetical protein
MKGEIMTSMKEELKPIKKAMGHILDLTLDPWEQIHSETTERIISATSPHLIPVLKFYNIKKSHYCMVLGNVTHCDIICAHIWPSYTLGRGLDTINLTREDVNNPRNFLRLHRSIEKAFDKKRLYFVRDDADDGEVIQLVVVIVDPDLLNDTYEKNNTVCSFSELQGFKFAHRFTPSAKPYLRLLAIHATKTIEKAQGFGWISAGDIPAQRERALRLARLSLNEVEINTLFLSLATVL